ncbi:MAG TPA: RDD family protein [Pseudonocardiaceae bacterium]|nr:RDD family protein [Pseudonocardiaceae bacterium]
MAGRFETWLAGGKAAAPTNTKSDQSRQDSPDRQFPGRRYGLPAGGPGSVASLGRRLVALFVDCVLATLITTLFVHPASLNPDHVQNLNYWSLLTWYVITVLGTAFFGVTPGMVLLGIRVARVDGRPMLLPLRALVRAVLVATIIPAVVWDPDRRGLHDKAAGTIVLTTR